MADSERSAEPIRRHDAPHPSTSPPLPTRAPRGASRPPSTNCASLPTKACLEPCRLELSYLELSCHKPAAGGWRTASTARRLFGGTTSPSSHPQPIADESAARSESTAARRLSASNHRQSRTPPASNPRSPHKKRVMPPHFSCGHMTRIFTPFQAHIPHLILPISMLISSAFTLCVSAPTEMTSTPAAAAAASVVSSMPPDASTTAR